MFVLRSKRLTASFPVASLAIGTLLTFAFPGPARADLGPCMPAIKAIEDLHSYRTTITSTRNGKSSMMTIDVVKPNRVHMKSDRMDMIAIGKQSWMNMGGSGYRPFPGFDIGAAFSMAKDFFKDDKDDACSDGGMGLYHGQPAHIFKMTHTGGKMMGSRSTMYVFGDGLVHHVDTTTSHGPVATDLTEFNSVSVNPPN